jgi:hypothetical protein
MASSEINLDAVGIFWTTLAIFWTLAILAGASFLLHNRQSAPLRIRGIPLSVGAVALLHGYWISVQLGYVVHDAMPGDAEYWIMGTWLPLGIALFHASNSRFLHVAKAQRRFVRDREEKEEEDVEEEEEQGRQRLEEKIAEGRFQRRRGQEHARRELPPLPRGLMSRFRRLDHTRKIFALVATGMLFQVR